MKILQLCRKFPYPLKDGESIAVTYLAKAFRDLGAKLTLLSFNTVKHFFPVENLPPSFNHYEAIHTVYLNNHPEPISAFLNLFSSDSYHVSRFTTKAYAKKLKEILNKEKFDIIQLESVYFAPYIPIIRQFSTAKVVMRAHNVEFEIWERIAQNTSFIPKKWYLTYLAKKLKNYEIAQLANYDLLLGMTQKDLNYFIKLGYSKDCSCVPVGLKLSDYQNFSFNTNVRAISFIGSLDWVPNQEGLLWFLDKVWGEVREKIPNLTFHIAGRNTPEWVFQKTGNGVVVHGEIPDSKAFLKQYPVSIVPLFSGSGMRVKILESMALGRAVLSTTVGLEGIPAQDDLEVFIVNDREEFIEKLNLLFENEQKMRQLMESARLFIEEFYDNQQIAKGVLQRYEEIIL